MFRKQLNLLSAVALAAVVGAMVSMFVPPPQSAHAQAQMRVPVFTETGWNPASIADGDEEVNDVTATGAALGDACIASFSLDVTDITVACSITAADVATVQLGNWTGGAIDLASGTVRVWLFKRTDF